MSFATATAVAVSLLTSPRLVAFQPDISSMPFTSSAIPPAFRQLSP